MATAIITSKNSCKSALWGTVQALFHARTLAWTFCHNAHKIQQENINKKWWRCLYQCDCGVNTHLPTVKKEADTQLLRIIESLRVHHDAPGFAASATLHWRSFSMQTAEGRTQITTVLYQHSQHHCTISLFTSTLCTGTKKRLTKETHQSLKYMSLCPRRFWAVGHASPRFSDRRQPGILRSPHKQRCPMPTSA